MNVDLTHSPFPVLIGHTQSWGLAHPEVLTKCGKPRKGQVLSEYGPVNPIKSTTYKFMTSLFKEINQVFPDPWVHLGGDEVDKSCW